MNNQQRAAMRQAIEALEYWVVRDEFNGDTREAIEAKLKEKNNVS